MMPRRRFAVERILLPTRRLMARVSPSRDVDVRAACRDRDTRYLLLNALGDDDQAGAIYALGPHERYVALAAGTI